jgi:hypothetical protein
VDEDDGQILGRGAGGIAIQLLTALGGAANPRVRKALIGWAITQEVYVTQKAMRLSRLGKRVYSVAVPGDDALYSDVHRWVVDHLAADKRRALVVRSTKATDLKYLFSATDDGGHKKDPPKIRLFYDGTRQQTVEIDGHRVIVSVERPDGYRGGQGPNERSTDNGLVQRERIVFTCYDGAARDAVLQFLHDLTDQAAARLPRFFIASHWGGWVNRDEIPPRPLDSVVLRAGQKELIVADMEKFLHGEQSYTHWGMPYHRGYLFHGMPGTGKTSIASALANHLGLDVYYIALGAVDNDGTLAELLQGVEPRSVLLLEDIDIVHGAKTRDDAEKKGVSLAGLLNALDGFITPHGLITIMTTNNRAILDTALVRPGRVDVDQHIPCLDREQLDRLLVQFLGTTSDILPNVDLVLDMGITPAEIMGVLKERMDESVTARARALRDFFSELSYETETL